MQQEPRFHIIRIEEDLEEQTDETRDSVDYEARANRIRWSELNTTLVTVHEDGFIRKWDVEVISSA